MIFLNLFTVCSSCKQKFYVCPFVYEETNGSYLFENGLKELSGLNGIAHASCPYRMSTLHVHAVCSCCMSLVHVSGGCLCNMYTLHVYAVWPRRMLMLMLHVLDAFPFCMSVLHVHAESHVLSFQSVLAALSWRSPNRAVLSAGPVLKVLFCLSCSGCPIPPVLSRLSSPCVFVHIYFIYIFYIYILCMYVYMYVYW